MLLWKQGLGRRRKQYCARSAAVVRKLIAELCRLLNAPATCRGGQRGGRAITKTVVVSSGGYAVWQEEHRKGMHRRMYF